MQFRSITRATQRGSFLALCAIVALTLYTVLQARRPAPAPPLPGTYQYFVETDFHSTTKHFGAVSHCDARFAPSQAPDVNDVRQSLTALLKSYAATMDELNVETWIAHGALLGWYWNRKLLPWDTDLDVQVSAEGISFLAKSYNMTEYRHRLSESEAPRTYLLDINPHFSITLQQDVANKIDGRWIDTSNGKFIDITAVHREQVEGVERKSTNLFCKDGHRYKEGDIYPLQPSILEGVKVNVPFGSKNVLREEYGRRALSNDRFHWHRFNRASKLWEPE